MKKSQKKLSLKKIAISSLKSVYGGDNPGGNSVWCGTITTGLSGVSTCNYTGVTCPPTLESQCCDTRGDSHCDRES